nr:hypothetical protein [Planctomycetota bacterium]
VLGDARLRAQALRLVRAYDRAFSRNFRSPFARSTLDAACEDKEAGIYCFLAAYRAYLATNDPTFAEQARIAGEWISTFVYFWNVGSRAGSICHQEGFSSTFWPGVSVQNMHLDVFFPAFELADLGRRLRDPMLVGIGEGVMAAWTHGICQRPGHWGFPTPGEQGEQFFQTNWGLSIDHWRGGANRWNPAWIIALVLQAALKFSGGSGNASRRKSRAHLQRCR